MSRWKQYEIDYLYHHAGDGLQSIADRLGRSCASVRNQASRYGISLRQSHICSRCGCITHYPIHPTKGWCRVCSLEVSRERAKKANERIRAEVEREERRLLTVTRERQAYYASTHRYKKKLRKIRESKD